MQSRRNERLVVPIPDWSHIQRQLWDAGLGPVPGRIVRYHAPKRRPMTNRNGARAFGRLLTVARAHNIELCELRPSEWFCPDVMDISIDKLVAEDNCNNSINVRAWDLRRAFKVMEPTYDSSWITKPDGVPLRSLFSVELHRVPLIGVTQLYDGVLDLLDKAVRIRAPQRRAITLRNALILAVLIARAL